MLTKHEIQAAQNGLDPMTPDGARGLIKYRRWAGGVLPYVLDKSVSKLRKLYLALYIAFKEVAMINNDTVTMRLVRPHNIVIYVHKNLDLPKSHIFNRKSCAEPHWPQGTK